MKSIVYSTRLSYDKNYKGPDEIILEIWIENLRICINEKNMAFTSQSPRTAINHFGTFNLPDKFCEGVKTLIESREIFEAGNIKVFTNLRVQLKQNKSQHTIIKK